MHERFCVGICINELLDEYLEDQPVTVGLETSYDGYSAREDKLDILTDNVEDLKNSFCSDTPPELEPAGLYGAEDYNSSFEAIGT